MLVRLCEWFVFKGHQEFQDFPLSVAIDAVVKAINDSSGEMLEGMKSNVPEVKLCGSSFNAIYDVFFTLFYNVVEHSDLPKGDIGLIVDVTIHANTFHLIVTNKINNAKDALENVDMANRLTRRALSARAWSCCGGL